jgi:hypothetical protein
MGIRRGVALGLGLAVVSALACFRPNVASGGLTCAPGNVCPDGLECALVDNRCYEHDAGPVCNSPPPQKLCDPASSGGACDPTCQTGCACGRCTVVNEVATCLTPGNKKRGELCNLTADDCEAGFGCVADECGGIGRCARFCVTNDDCRDGLTTCSVGLGGGFRACGSPPVMCDAMLGYGCPKSLFCYYQDGADRTFCECPGSQEEADRCTFYNDCIPGYTCVTITGVTTCRRLCTSTGNECTAPQTCSPLGDVYGYCR